MATLPLTDAAVLVAGYDLTGDANALDLEYSAEMLDGTTYGNDTRIHKGGLKSVSAAVRGFYNTGSLGDPDSALFSRIGTSGLPVSIIPARTAGERAFLFKSTGAAYDLGGEIGQLTPFSLDLDASKSNLVRGTLMADETSEAASSNASAVQVGALSSSQSMYAALHVIAASGTTPTLDVIVQSDDNSGMSSATTRISFTQATAVTSEWSSVAGAVTDDYWRISWTIGGTTPSFDFVVTIGIL